MNKSILKEVINDRYEQLLDQIVQKSSYAESLSYFTDALKKPFNPNIDTEQECNNAMIFGTYCIQVPDELIYAAGAQPVRLCMGVEETADLCDNCLPKLACPLMRSLTGYMDLEIPFFHSIKHFIIPTTCDWKVKHYEKMDAEYSTWLMDLPHQRDTETSRKKWFSEIVRLKEWLEKQSGRKIRRQDLMAGIDIVHEAQNAYYKFLSFRREGYISGCEAMLISNASFYIHLKEWTRALNKLNQAILDNRGFYSKSTEKQQLRILLTGSPLIFPNFKIPILLEETGCVIVADELCSSERIFSDVVTVDNKTEAGLLQSISDRYLLPCTCPTFSTNRNRLKRLLEFVNQFKIDGIVYHVLKGCHPYDIESFSIEKSIKEKKIPFLKLETDYSQEDTGQIKTRIEAFSEMLQFGVRNRQ
jgi:benzoyl-CoA reductase/2-hydroxyglutaryl-CoA dehydratase subunit BcrC/BadD/HgdB